MRMLLLGLKRRETLSMMPARRSSVTAAVQQWHRPDGESAYADAAIA